VSRPSVGNSAPPRAPVAGDDDLSVIRSFHLDALDRLQTDASTYVTRIAETVRFISTGGQQCQREVQLRLPSFAAGIGACPKAHKKLLDAHNADAIPLDLLKSEQDRLTAEIANAEGRLAEIAGDFKAAEINLAHALTRAGDCAAA